MNNIILIGMPGVGKSTIGVILAKLVGYQFIDTDLVIQEKEQKLLHQIIKDEGIEGFIDIENRVNAGIKADRSVIATGGSVIYGTKAMKHLSDIGTIVYLRAPYEVLSRRLNNIKGRGVVLRNGQTLLELYEERTGLYEKYAAIIVDEEDGNIEGTIEKITERLKKG
ncbi:shikimate kinase [Lachnospiraceae bacterium ZAX-1]